MKKFETEKISDLADVFYSLMGGYPESIREIEEFMKNSPLKELIFASDVEQVLKYDGFFSDETVDAVYALLPVKIKLNENKSVILSPQAFRKLNRERIALPASRVINISFPKAFAIYQRSFLLKMEDVMKAIKSPQKFEQSQKNNSDIKQQTEQLPKTTHTKTQSLHKGTTRSYYAEKKEIELKNKEGLPKVVQKQLEKAAKEKKKNIKRIVREILKQEEREKKAAQKEILRREKEVKKAQHKAYLKRKALKEKERIRAEKAEAKRQELERKKQQKEIEKAEKKRLLEEKKEAERLAKEQKKIRKLKKHEQKIKKEFKQIQANREDKERQQIETQQIVWQEIARLDEKANDLEKRKNKPLEELSEEEREKEKQRRHMAEYRKKHPEKKTKNQRKPISELTEEEQNKIREANRRRNAVYRERHREELRQSRNARRAKLKEENPELLKEMDRQSNARPARKKAGRTYYLTKIKDWDR